MHVRRPMQAVVLILIAARGGPVQRPVAKFTVDSKSSLAWWQVLPHLGHLWATTCPQEPSWLPGEGRTTGGRGGADVVASTEFAEDSSRVPIPLFPRYRVRPVCTEAAHGEIVASDTVTWKGTHGKVAVDAAALTQGSTIRDAFAHGVVLDAANHPQIVLTIDSVVDVRASGPARDTLRAVAVGTFSFRGVESRLRVPVVVWHDAGGIRVEGRWLIRPTDLTDTYKIPTVALSLGVGFRIWQQLWVGIDLVMRPEPVTP